MQDEGLDAVSPEDLSGAFRYRPGQCWRLRESVRPFGAMAILLARIRTTGGEAFWELAVPRTEHQEALWNRFQRSVGASEASAFTESEGGRRASPEGTPGGVVLAVPEEVLAASCEELLAEGWVPGEVRLLLRVPKRVYFTEGPVEEGLREVAAAWQWEADQQIPPSPENFRRAIQQGDLETAGRLLRLQPGLLEQILPGEPMLPGKQILPGEPMLPGESGKAEAGAEMSPGEPTPWMASQEDRPGPALCWAVRSARPEVVAWLLEQGADVNAADETGQTPLHWAARLAEMEIVRILLDYPVDMDRPDGAGQTPLRRAARSLAWEAPRVAQFLLDAGATPDLNSLVALGRVAQVQTLLHQNPQALSAAPEPDQLLQDALLAIHRAIAHRMAPEITDPEVLQQIMAEYLPLMECLLQAGADPNAGFPLWTAVQLPDPRPAAMLLAWGADPNQKIEENRFPLLVARTPALQELLRRHGAKHPEDPDLIVLRETRRLAENPEDTESLRRRAEALAQLGRYEEALADWAALIHADPENPEGYLGQAWIWATCPDDRFRHGQAAWTAARRAVELAGGWDCLAQQHLWDPQTGQVSVRSEYWLTYAAALAELGQFPEAVQILDQLLRMVPDRDRPRIRYIRSLFREHQPYRTAPPEEEQQRYQPFLQEPPKPRSFWSRLKHHLLRLGALFRRGLAKQTPTSG